MTQPLILPLSRPAGRSARRGSAVFVVMIMTMALAALAGSAMLMTSGARLVSNYHNEERDLRYGAESALQDGMSDLNNNPFSLPDSGYVQTVFNAQLMAADGTPVPGVVYNLYAGPTGSATKQTGRFVTLVAIAVDTARQRQFVRRVELNQQTFARFAYFSNSESGICFGSNDRLNGPIFSNDVIQTCGSPQKADFMDSVFTPQTFINNDPALDTAYDGWTKVPNPLTLPNTSQLAKLYPIAASGNTEFFTPNVATDSTSQLRSRLEFVAYDLNGDADSTNPGEGFVRYYQVDEGAKVFMPAPVGVWTPAQLDSVTFSYLRSGLGRQHDVNNCGEWRDVFDDNGNLEWEFFPIAVHHTTWYKTIVAAAQGGVVPPAVSLANHIEVTGAPAPADTITVAGMAKAPLRNGSSSSRRAVIRAGRRSWWRASVIRRRRLRCGRARSGVPWAGPTAGAAARTRHLRAAMSAISRTRRAWAIGWRIPARRRRRSRRPSRLPTRTGSTCSRSITRITPASRASLRPTGRWV